MLAHQTQKNLLKAREYFREHLQIDDYYSAGKQAAVEWLGCGAERLRLTGRVAEEQFLRLCDNQQPTNGERLTVRMKQSGSRSIFEDFVFCPPKSVSIAALIGGELSAGKSKRWRALISQKRRKMVERSITKAAAGWCFTANVEIFPAMRCLDMCGMKEQILLQ